mgnify:CR=1 FL=1
MNKKTNKVSVKRGNAKKTKKYLGIFISFPFALMSNTTYDFEQTLSFSIEQFIDMGSEEECNSSINDFLSFSDVFFRYCQAQRAQETDCLPSLVEWSL